MDLEAGAKDKKPWGGLPEYWKYKTPENYSVSFHIHSNPQFQD